VLSNLIGNANKFTPRGGRIVLRVEPFGDCAMFSVEDDGPGIRADDLGHLFEPFWQARGTRKNGAGLGLTIAKGIIDAHGGTIWPESAPGRGTTMFFTVPLAEERRGTSSTGAPDGVSTVNDARLDQALNDLIHR
jgi:signal transduction histidine kinase